MHDYLYKQVLGKCMRINNRDLIWYVGIGHEEYEDYTDEMTAFFREMPFHNVSTKELYE